jgi:hypothetical protein
MRGWHDDSRRLAAIMKISDTTLDDIRKGTN